MIVKQLSVFLENKVGRVNEVAQILGEHGINMSAFCLAESADFGILRMVVSNVQRAEEVLRSHRFSVKVTDVICLQCPNEPGALSKILNLLAKEDLFIEYMYAFSHNDKANIVIRPNNTERCLEVLKHNQQTFITSGELCQK